jgi:hypothetical protein
MCHPPDTASHETSEASQGVVRPRRIASNRLLLHNILASAMALRSGIHVKRETCGRFKNILLLVASILILLGLFEIFLRWQDRALIQLDQFPNRMNDYSYQFHC